MLRDRMFGSMMVSSASGLFRIRPETSPGRRRNILLKGSFTLNASEPTPALEMMTLVLTDNKLLHLLPLKIISSFMSDRDGDSPLDALCNTDGKKNDSRLILSFVPFLLLFTSFDGTKTNFLIIKSRKRRIICGLT